jgi:hypothetical protein
MATAAFDFSLLLRSRCCLGHGGGRRCSDGRGLAGEVKGGCGDGGSGDKINRSVLIAVRVKVSVSSSTGGQKTA